MKSLKTTLSGAAPVLLLLAGLLLAGLTVPGPFGPDAGAAQESHESENPDSTDLLEEAREKQRSFERYRESRLPPSLRDGGLRCDDMVGRLCLIQGDEDEDLVPPEPMEVRMARQELLRTLREVSGEIPGDRWVLGQQVYYLVEDERWREVEILLGDCESAPWWCGALRGYAAQMAGSHESAATEFDEAFALMPAEVEARFHILAPIVDRDGQRFLEDLPEEDFPAFETMFWVMSDPLYLVDGNDRLVEHWTRVVTIMIRENAENPYDLPWEDDLAELVLRYGQETGWERAKSLRGVVTGRDTRSIVGHHDPRGRQFAPPTFVMEDPFGVPVGEWSLEDRVPFSAYTPPYAPDFEELEAQVARFRRGDSLLVVASYQPASREPAGSTAVAADEPRASDDPFGSLAPTPAPSAETDDYFAGPVESGMFLVDAGGRQAAEHFGEERKAVYTLRAPAGRYFASIEVHGADDGKAWRARGGVRQDTLPPGLAAVSDILVLDGDGPLPESLDEALPRTLPAVRVRQGERMTLAWEVYGLRPGEAAEVTVGFTRHQDGVLRRLGEFLRVIETEEPIVVAFEDAAPDRLGTVFRALDVNLPSLEPGEYDVLLEVDLAGREPMVSSRRLVVTGDPGG